MWGGSKALHAMPVYCQPFGMGSLSDVLNNVATALIAAPISIKVADAIGASPDPFLMGVAVAAGRRRGGVGHADLRRHRRLHRHADRGDALARRHHELRRRGLARRLHRAL